MNHDVTLKNPERASGMICDKQGWSEHCLMIRTVADATVLEDLDLNLRI
jgi:hypothetical protein